MTAQIIDLVAYRAAKKREQRTSDMTAFMATYAGQTNHPDRAEPDHREFTDDELVDLRKLFMEE